MTTLLNKWRELTSDSCRLGRDEEGQFVIFTALSALALVMMVAAIFNVGVLIGEKMEAQNASDAAAYSQAVWEARVLNLTAYTNRAIISHMVTIAFWTAFYSQEELWRLVRDIATVIPPPVGPPIRAGAQIMFQIMNAFTSIDETIRVRDTALIWINACQIFQGLVIGEFYADMLRTNSVQNRVATAIDPDILVNRSADQVIGNAVVLANTLDFTDLTGFSPANPLPPDVDFESFRDVYINSMDGWADGSAFPRTAGPPFSLAFNVQLAGEVDVEEDEIEQEENLLIQVGGFRVAGVEFWLFEEEIEITEVEYDDLKIGEQGMYNVLREAAESDNPFPSIFTYAVKSGGNITQFPFFGIESDRDIRVLSRAEAFYWDPDRDRSDDLSGENPPLEPNLFNPFWHARLAPVNDALGVVSQAVSQVVPITH